MAQRVELLAAARQEVADAFEWYQERSVRAADSFVRELSRGLALIAESPDLAELRARFSSLYPSALSVLGHLRAETTRIVVVAMAHHSRKPGYWHKR